MRHSRLLPVRVALSVVLLAVPGIVVAQGVTTSALTGIVTGSDGVPIQGANVTAVHVPSGTEYRAAATSSGRYNLPNLRVGGPYTVTAASIGYEPQTERNVFLALGPAIRIDFQLTRLAVQMAGVQVTAELDDVRNSSRTGAGMRVDLSTIATTPSIKRSARDLTRLDPRSDGNMSFAGRNWLYNNVSLDGSYFNNAFGLDDPTPGGQTNAEPVPYDAIAELQLSIAPFDVREGGFTGANVNLVTKSGTNELRGSLYSFFRSDAFQGNEVSGSRVTASPDHTYNQTGVALGGPIVRDRLFFYLNAELERTKDPGSNFVASTGNSGLGISRVQASVMDQIRQRMITEYNYDPGPYQGYFHRTDNDKVLLKLDWNARPGHTASFRFNYLDAKRDLPPHPFVLSFGNTGRGPNSSSLPFYKSGYAINNGLQSYALEVNSRGTRFANRFFASYNRFRDFRQPFSEDFPTIDIGEDGVTYTTLGHEPFSIHNILDQDVWQFTNNFSFFRGAHAFTVGANFESFDFFNSFNIFRHGVFFLPGSLSFGSTFASVQEFLDATQSGSGQKDFRGMIGGGAFKGEQIHTGQLSLYVQDEWFATQRLRLTYGLRMDMPMYFTDPVDNPFSRSLSALDENRQSEQVDQSRLPDAEPVFSPRFGFNWNAVGDRETQVRGGTGVFAGRVPFVWIGNVISNPGENPNLAPPNAPIPTKHGSTLQQSFDLNAMVSDFEWPRVWTTDIAVDQQLPWGMLGTAEVIYSKDLAAVYVRNADLVAPVRTLYDGRPYFGGFGNNELNPDGGGAGIYVIDNTDRGHSINFTAQLRKNFGIGINTMLGYSFTEAKNALKSTEIASVLWQNQPVQGDPNNPELSYSEFGQRHRIIGSASYTRVWNAALKTQFGLILEMAEGNRFAGAGGNRYSFIYAGDVNGDGTGGNDLIYIPRNEAEARLVDYQLPNNTTVTASSQWAALNAFIEQDNYLSSRRGQIAERFGLVNPWYTNIDLRILQDFALGSGLKRHTFQLSLDILNVANLLNSDWGVRQIANATATSPLRLAGFDGSGNPQFNFIGPARTFDDDPNPFSRWRAQFGLRYLFDQ